MIQFKSKLFINEYFPLPGDKIPFGGMLNQIFFEPLGDNQDFPIHGPNVIRFIEALVDAKLENEPGLIKVNEKRTRGIYNYFYPKIMEALEINIDSSGVSEQGDKTTELLKVAALYHDLGKCIRRANHPQIGSNLLRNYSEEETRKLADVLVYEKESLDIPAKYNRFSLIGSIVQHHDKFGVVSTGEGGLPIFSDILYFTSDENTISGIKKNITSVMLTNLADIAAVNTASPEKRNRAIELAKSVGHRSGKDEPDPLDELIEICKEPESSLGVDSRKVSCVLKDWEILIKTISLPAVMGNRVDLKIHLLEIERNPARAIQRILRLLEECSETTGASSLLNYISPTSVESVLVGTLGAHQFQTFCEQLATVVKLDYGLRFFQAIICACVRKELDENYTFEDENKKGWPAGKLKEAEIIEFDKLDRENNTRVTRLANKITILFIRVLEELVNRYAGVLDYGSPNPRRFGFQMRDLTGDQKIRDTIIDLLCIKKHKDPIALTWIVDEVTIWSMD